MAVDPEAFHGWDAKTQATAAKRLKDLVDNPPRIWYCNVGRTCDGLPHEGVPYNHARGDQWPPVGVDWFVWAMLSGRGAGKTRSGTEYARKMRKHVSRIAAIAQTTRDMRAVMVEGDSGLIRVCEAAKVEYDWKPTNREFTFLDTGCKVQFYTGEEPDSLRGPQHGLAWLDEPAHMPLIEEVWSNLVLGLRLGKRPRVLVTTTPLPIPWVKRTIALPTTRVVRVSTYANLANLAPTYREQVISQYEGTRLGRQELHGEVIDDVEGALWNGDLIEGTIIEGDFLRVMPENPRDWPWESIVVSIDPAGTSTKRSDETGIIVVGLLDNVFYVLEDLSGRHSPDVWAKIALKAYRNWKADRIVAEKNYGGDMVAHTLRNQDQNAPLTLVNSRRGKELRAEPVVALYEQRRVRHMRGLNDLETQQVEWVPSRGSSPDRVDALVHGITHLSSRTGRASIETAADMPLMIRQPWAVPKVGALPWQP